MGTRVVIYAYILFECVYFSRHRIRQTFYAYLIQIFSVNKLNIEYQSYTKSRKIDAFEKIMHMSQP